MNENKEKALSLLEEIIRVETGKDFVEKQKDLTLSGDNWTVFHLKALRILIEE